MFLVWDSPQGRAVRELDRALVVIGRDATCDLVLDDVTVSRRHVLLQVEGGVKITDLRSTAGTRINGAKVKPDVPCTLEPGDFLQVGKVVLSFHAVAPPPVPPSFPPTQVVRQPTAVWKPVAIGLAFVAVAAGGALLAFLDRKEPPPPAPVVATPQPKPKPEAEPPPVPVEKPAPTPEPPKEAPPPAAPERAAAGELPPRQLAPELPDLIEVDGKTHLPARVRKLGEDRVEVVGADGRLYALPLKRVTKIEDRADLARRVAVSRRRLAPDDVAGRIALGEWCAARLLRDEARALLREALSIKPDDAAARAAKARIEEQE